MKIYSQTRSNTNTQDSVVQTNNFEISKLFIFILCIFLPTITYAYSVTGRVMDENKSPIPFSNVVLLKDSLFINGTITNDDGQFFFSEVKQGANKVKISAIGYEDYFSSLPPTGDFGTITLVPSAITLDEVVVKATLPKTQIKGSSMVTNVQNTVLSKMGTAYDVVSHIPLVTGINGELEVFGRGTPTVYINGREVRNQSDLLQLKSDDIRSVELITNPGAAYASNIHSVIRIKTNPIKGDGFGFDISNSLRFWSFARNTTDVNLRYRHNGLDIFGNLYVNEGKRKDEDISELITYGENIFSQSIFNSGHSISNDIFGKIGFSYELNKNHSIGAYYRYGSAKGSGKGTIATNSNLNIGGSETDINQLQADYRLKSNNHPSQEANIYYNGNIGNVSVDFNADFMQNRTKNEDWQYEYQIDDINNKQEINAAGLSTNRLFAEKLIVSLPVWNGSLEIGEEYTNSKLAYKYGYIGAPINNSFTDIHENSVAGFTTITQSFGKWNVSVGLRYERASYKYYENGSLDLLPSKTYHNIFPSFSINTKINKVRLSLDFTNKMNRPSYRKLDGGISYINKYVYQSGNPLLKPTTIYNLQAMAMWRYFYGVAMYSYEKNSIFNTTRTYEMDPMVKVMTYTNVPHYQNLQLLIGAQPSFGCWQTTPEIGILKQFCDLYYRGRNTKFNKPMYSLTWENIITLPHDWQFGADLYLYSAANSKNCYVKSTQQLSFSIRKSFFNESLILQLKAIDVLDRGSDKVTIYSGDIQNYMYNHHQPRNIMLSIRYVFNKTRSKYKGEGAGKSEKRRM